METFSLLKYWRGGGGGGGECDGTRAIVTTVAHPSTDTDDDDGGGDDGPFFDLEFGVNEEDGDGGNSAEGENASDFGVDAEAEDDDEDDQAAAESDGEFDFTLSSASSSDGGNSDVNLSLSPANDLFFKGRLLPVVETDDDPNSKPQFPVSLMKSAAKLRVFMLGLKKARAEQKEPPEKSRPPEEKQAAADKKMFSVKFKVEEVPIKPLFTRENSSRSFYNSQKRNPPAEEAHSVSDDKLFSKEAVQRYLKKVKPLYVRVSRRYGEKLKISGQIATRKFPPEKSAEGAEPVTVASPKLQKSPVGLREVCKHLGKSRSASAAVAAVTGGSRRDDSLLEQHDGIQGAILHCKRSFNASRDSESSMFLRSVSGLLQDNSSNLRATKSSEQESKVCCV